MRAIDARASRAFPSPAPAARPLPQAGEVMFEQACLAHRSHATGRGAPGRTLRASTSKRVRAAVTPPLPVANRVDSGFQVVRGFCLRLVTTSRFRTDGKDGGCEGSRTHAMARTGTGSDRRRRTAVSARCHVLRHRQRTDARRQGRRIGLRRLAASLDGPALDQGRGRPRRSALRRRARGTRTAGRARRRARRRAARPRVRAMQRLRTGGRRAARIVGGRGDRTRRDAQRGRPSARPGCPARAPEGEPGAEGARLRQHGRHRRTGSAAARVPLDRARRRAR